MTFSEHILNSEHLRRWRENCRLRGERVVASSGCFDLLHVGHVGYLEVAHTYGDVLIVGINSDGSVRQLKGQNRPINSQQNRACVLATLRCVDRVFIFEELIPVRFLELSQPDVYVKGGDYSWDSLHEQERAILKRLGTKTVFVPFINAKSTSSIIADIKCGNSSSIINP